MHANVYMLWAKVINEPKVIVVHFYDLCKIMYGKKEKCSKLMVCSVPH